MINLHFKVIVISLIKDLYVGLREVVMLSPKHVNFITPFYWNPFTDIDI